MATAFGKEMLLFGSGTSIKFAEFNFWVDVGKGQDICYERGDYRSWNRTAAG